jgi:hypothetical protein
MVMVQPEQSLTKTDSQQGPTAIVRFQLDEPKQHGALTNEDRAVLAVVNLDCV